MAKALLGFMSTTDPQAMLRLAAENRRLRQRVADLEEHVLRLHAERAAAPAPVVQPRRSRSESMQPA